MNEEASSKRMFPLAPTWCWLALAALILLVYWPGIGGGYAFDDFPNIVDNPGVHVTQSSFSQWLSAAWSSPASDLPRPLAMLSFGINHYFTGLDPVPMKLTNICIHVLNSLLVLWLARLLLRTLISAQPTSNPSRGDWIALFISAAWALHPINLMAVLFVVQRMEALSHTFVLLGLGLYVTARLHQAQGRQAWALLGFALVGCTVLGALAKESAVLLPLYALCLEFCFFKFTVAGNQSDGRLRWVFVAVLLVPALLALAWLLPKAMAPGAFASRSFTLSERLLTEPRVLLDYLHWLVLPDLGQLSLYHDDYLPSRGFLSPPSTLLGVLAIPALFAMACWIRNTRPLSALGILWFLSAHVLTAGFIPLELVFEHRNYFASLGVCIVFADLLLLAPELPRARAGGAALALIALAFFTGITLLRAKEWSDPVRFAFSEAAKHPHSPRATYNLGRTLVIMSNYNPTSPFVPLAVKALDQSRRLPGSTILPNQAELMLQARAGLPIDHDLWIQMQEKLRTQPLGPQPLAALAGLTSCAVQKHCLFPPEQMLASFAAALSKGPQPEVLNIYGNYVLNVLQDPDLALRLWTEAAALKPREPQYHRNLAKLNLAMGRTAEARLEAERLRQCGWAGQYEGEADALLRRIGNPGEE